MAKALSAALSVLVISLLLCVSPARSLSFEIHKERTKCMNEELHSGALVLGEYRVTDPKELDKPAIHKIHARLSDPDGYTLHLAEGVDKGQFGFKASTTGVYVACFWLENVDAKEAVVAVDLDWKTGVAAKDWGNIAKREHIDGVELELRKIEELVDSIHEEMLFLREKEQEMRAFNESTNTRIVVLGALSLLFCLLVAVFQSLHMKVFFERKKLL
ncbi:hypothetical protein SELMODRAFT_117173 [Selaginella moellendorffii]|uniref:GOLD domain-containing protein n=1 Tax=Selaginella moellendorffii TaxID=88036 RepID=D8SHX9_SELML|nr:transmembrane emp24 domain-containing protein p24delta9 [Selaginella moellendorffii]EFJ16199.1 hypothetical protein SELMODRAFT_117173 [Selaginella moellendorffii]|eukprot:XP_002982954.1 transmembrane emp24 domain-containing protein p24delta9 [Selaginella moellendorffii]